MNNINIRYLLNNLKFCKHKQMVRIESSQYIWNYRLYNKIEYKWQTTSIEVVHLLVITMESGIKNIGLKWGTRLNREAQLTNNTKCAFYSHSFISSLLINILSLAFILFFIWSDGFACVQYTTVHCSLCTVHCTIAFGHYFIFIFISISLPKYHGIGCDEPYGRPLRMTFELTSWLTLLFWAFYAFYAFLPRFSHSVVRL